MTLVLRLFEAVRYTRKPHDAGRFRPSETGGDTPSTPTLKNNRDYKHSATFVFMGYPHVQYCTKPALGFSSHFLALSMIVNVDGPPLSGTPSFVTGANAEQGRSTNFLRLAPGSANGLFSGRRGGQLEQEFVKIFPELRTSNLEFSRKRGRVL